jgi:hypothetical protein
MKNLPHLTLNPSPHSSDERGEGELFVGRRDDKRLIWGWVNPQGHWLFGLQLNRPRSRKSSWKSKRPHLEAA